MYIVAEFPAAPNLALVTAPPYKVGVVVARTGDRWEPLYALRQGEVTPVGLPSCFRLDEEAIAALNASRSS